MALLPFVEEKRLFKALEPYYKDLSPEEIKRNVRGDDKLYVSPHNSGYDLIKSLYARKIEFNVETAISIDGMKGTILITEESVKIGG